MKRRQGGPRVRARGLLLTVVLAPSLSGCLALFGDPPPDDGLVPQFVLVPGEWYQFILLQGSESNRFPEGASISPSGTMVAVDFGQGNVGLWSVAGVPVGRLPADANISGCVGGSSLGKFVNDSFIFGFLGGCAAIFDIHGEVVALGELPVGIDDPETGLSFDALAYAVGNETFAGVREVFGDRNVSVSLVPSGYSVDYESLSPDGTILAVVRSSTRFYSVDLQNVSITLMGEFPRAGRIFFASDSKSAVQGREAAYGLSPDSVAFYDFSSGSPTASERSCARTAGQVEWPICPRDVLSAVSPNGRFLAWDDSLEVNWNELDGTGNATNVALVHILDRAMENRSRGFQAGPAAVGSSRPQPAAERARAPVLMALRLFDDGSAASVTRFGESPYSFHLTKAVNGSTIPTQQGHSV